jgi:mono/diheme cytochrome c family protein
MGSLCAWIDRMLGRTHSSVIGGLMAEQQMSRLADWAKWAGFVCVGAGCFGSACNSLDERGPQGSAVVIPVDVRGTQAALHAPPAISGGTLAATADGQFAIAADPDRDRVSIINLANHEVRQIALTPGDEPGRVAVDGGFAYVAMRRSGDIGLIDVANAGLMQRLHVCAAPRGMAVQPELGLVHVACNEGRLVTLQAHSAQAAEMMVVRNVALESDLRDVLVQGDELLVSKFKSAELLRVNAAGSLVDRIAIEDFENNHQGIVIDSDSTKPEVRHMQPHLAWRMARAADGTVFVLHQGAATDTVAIDAEALKPKANSSPYGGSGGFGGSCEGIVVPAVTRLSAQGGRLTVPVASGPLTVDLGVSSDGAQIAMVQAGAADPHAPRPQTVFDTDSDSAPIASGSTSPAFFLDPSKLPAGIDLQTTGTSSVMVQPSQVSGGIGCQSGQTITAVGQATALTFVRNQAGQRDSLLVQSREPALISVWRDLGSGPVFGGPESVIPLNGESVSDTGHEIFHRDAGGGLACASCHAEGAEDGHVWKFNTVGLRRTQALHVGLEGTAPFHWNGEETDLDHLMEDVFVKRMGGVHQSDARLAALTHYLFSLQPPAAAVTDDALAVERGHQLFLSPDVGCATCHTGAKLTNNQSVDVGTGGKLQVPSLRAVAYRAPFMHTGCAKTLRERFDPACGGAQHGKVASLSESQIGDLVSYLKTL